MLQILRRALLGRKLRNDALRHLVDLERRCRALEEGQRKLVEEQDYLANAFKRLRGTVTGGRRLRLASDSDVSEIPFGDKDALRAAAGIVPGRPFHHQE